MVFNKNSKGQGTGNTSVQLEDKNLLLPLGISLTVELNLILAEEISSNHQEQLTMEQLTVKQPVATLPEHPCCTDSANLKDSATADAPTPAPNSDCSNCPNSGNPNCPNSGNPDCPNPTNSDCANQQDSATAAPPPNCCSD